jgi:hypothetical protein
MEMPEFDRAEYDQPVVIEGYGEPPASRAAFPKALLFGFGAAAVGSLGYAIISLSGFMVSIVAIGIGWLVEKALMTASGGLGGRQYQVAAAVLTYFAVSCGRVWRLWWAIHQQLAADGGRFGNHPVWFAEILVRQALIGPFLGLTRSPLNAGLGLLILFFGVRTAWQMAAGSAAFGGGGRRMSPFGMR